MKERVLEPVEIEDEDNQEDLEESLDDDGVANLEAMVVSLAKHWSQLEAGQAEAEQMDNQQWSGRGVIEPTYSPRGLMWMYRNTSSLRSNVEAIAHNVDGFGWAAESVFDWDSEDIYDQVAIAIYLDKYAKWEIAVANGEQAEEPSMPEKAEVDEAIKKWKLEATIEKAKMKLHFDNACFEYSFIDLRKRSRVDEETTGWGAWEVIRSEGQTGKPVRYLHVPAYQLRLQQLGPPIPVQEKIKTSACTYRTITVYKRFRLIILQEEEASGVPVKYFRQYGDPRVVSSVTGGTYGSVEDLQAKEGDGAQPANEILMFMDYFPGSAYGAPRFHGAIPELKGSWLAANHIVDYLENSAVPRGMLLVNDGRLNPRSIRDLKNYFRTAKGKAENRLMVIQAESPRDRAFEGNASVRMDFVDLSKAQREDASFAKYDETVTKKVAQQFRLPPLLRGETEGFNRATAEAAIQYAEEQVFAPDRNTFDWMMNRFIIPALDIKFWKFKSRGPAKQDPEVLSKVLEVLLKQGVIVPAEAREIAERMLSVDLLRTAGDWQQLPLSLVQQGFKQEPKTNFVENENEGDDKDEDEQEPTQTLEAADAMARYRELVGTEKFDRLVEKFKSLASVDENTVAELMDDE
jgi:capsid portal protein